MAYSSKYKLTAERCIGLAELTVGDIKDDEGEDFWFSKISPLFNIYTWCVEGKNLFKLRTSSETFAFQADSAESKSFWIKRINDAIFEFRKSVNEQENDSKRKASSASGNDVSLSLNSF